MNKRRTLTPLIFIGLILIGVSLACQVITPVEQPTVPPVAQSIPNTPLAILEPVQTIMVEEDSENLLVELYARVNPSVVNITVYATLDGVLTALGQGSGFIYDEQGHLVTNAHVIHGAELLEITFSDGTMREAELSGEDLHSDLAVVQVEAMPEGASPLPLGDMEELAVGQTVVAIGNPFGLSGTLTRGIISALGRTIPALTQFSIPQSIQTDAAINPGNSGGPLLNLDGEVIGVNAQIETGGTGRANTGVGFAIPISIIQRVVPGLIESGSYRWPWLGVAGRDVTPVLIKAMNLPVERGAYLSEIVPEGPAAKAGLIGSSEVATSDGREIDTGGDIITAVNGQQILSFDDLLIYVALSTSPGDQITLTVLRGGETKQIDLVLGERPE